MANEANDQDGDPVVVRVPFAAAQRMTGKSFADDKRFVSSSAAGMQRRFDMSSMWNLFNSIATNVAKSAVQALVQIPGGKWLLKEELPDICMTNWQTGTSEPITKWDPDDPMKSLGMQTTAALSDGYARDEAKRAADRVAVCVAKGTAPEALWLRLLSQVAERSAMYKLRISCASPADIKDVQAKCHRTFKAKAGLCVTTPDLVVSALVTLDWTSKHFIEQLVLLLKGLQKSGTKLDGLIRSALQHHALWQGGLATIGSRLNPLRGWDGTMIGQLHGWMASRNLELRGPVEVPPGRQNDCLLIALATSDEERCLLSRGSWVVDAWRVSDLTRWDGTLTTSLDVSGKWARLIDQQEKGTGSEWCNTAIRLATNYLSKQKLGHRARGSIRLGAYVCIPAIQAYEGSGDSPTIGLVVADDSGTSSWDDTIEVKILRPLYTGPEDDGEQLWGTRLPLLLPTGGAEASCDLRGDRRARGSVHALLVQNDPVCFHAHELLEVKAVETPLKKALVLDTHSTTELLVQLDEDLLVADALAVWQRPRDQPQGPTNSFYFPEKNRVIGLCLAAENGWDTDWKQWGDLKRLECSRRANGKRTCIRLLSDGSVTGDGFDSHSTYGWACYGADADGQAVEECAGSPVTECIMAGCGAVDGPPEWTSSTRAEAAGALAALMGAVNNGWKGDIDLRLDNDSAVIRAGGLVLGASLDEVVLRDGHCIESADIWTEFVAWRDRHTSTGATITVKWHPGHPERRAKKEDWSREDRAIFLADQLAEVAHSAPPCSRQPTQWSHQAAWRIYWRGEELVGQVAKRLAGVVRTEQLAEYVQSVGVGPGTDTDWVIPELMARTIGRRASDLPGRVHRAKMTANILGTKHTRHRRNGLDDGEDSLCRLCGDTLETDSHLLWECTHPTVTQARTALCDRVYGTWREAGLGQGELAVANLLWRLDGHGTVRCKSASAINATLGDTNTGQAALLEEALLGHTLDTTGLFSDRAGLFGKGWLALLGALGLSHAEALNALVEVANVLQGPKGTHAIWKAFTAALEVPERDVVGEPRDQVSHSASFREWATELRARLRDEAVEDDEPYRLLAGAGASGMSTSDMANFACLVQYWADGMDGGGSDAIEAATWAADTTEALRVAGATVAQDRLDRGCTTIKARDKAREDTKANTLDRRQRMLAHTAHGTASREILRKSIAKLKPKQTKPFPGTQRAMNRTQAGPAAGKDQTVSGAALTARVDARQQQSTAAPATAKTRAQRQVAVASPKPTSKSARKRGTPRGSAATQTSDTRRRSGATALRTAEGSGDKAPDQPDAVWQVTARAARAKNRAAGHDTTGKGQQRADSRGLAKRRGAAGNEPPCTRQRQAPVLATTDSATDTDTGQPQLTLPQTRDTADPATDTDHATDTAQGCLHNSAAVGRDSQTSPTSRKRSSQAKGLDRERYKDKTLTGAKRAPAPEPPQERRAHKKNTRERTAQGTSEQEPD